MTANLKAALDDVERGLQAGSDADRSVGWVAACDRGLAALATIRAALEQQATDCAYWKAKFEQEERLRDAPKLTSTVMEAPPSATSQEVARKLVAGVCNQHRNSDLRSDHPAILSAIARALDAAISAEAEKVRRAIDAAAEAEKVRGK